MNSMRAPKKVSDGKPSFFRLMVGPSGNDDDYKCDLEGGAEGSEPPMMEEELMEEKMES